MKGRVVFVDFAAWGASEARQRAVCGPAGYVLRGVEARAAADAPTLPLGATTPAPRTADPTLPGMSAWLATHRPGVANT